MTEAAIEYLLCDVGTINQVCGDRFTSLLSPEEITKSNRFRRSEDSAAYRSAHIVFRLLAARRLGLAPADAGDLTFSRTCRSCGGAHGKPQISGAEFSLSRSSEMVMVAAAPASSPIGVDVERIPTDVFPGFDDYALADNESIPPDRDPTRHRLHLWVCKEAALKTTGRGLDLSPRTVEVVACSGSDSIIRSDSRIRSAHQWTGAIRAPGDSELNGLRVAPLPSEPAYAAALCCADPLRIEALDLQDLISSPAAGATDDAPAQRRRSRLSDGAPAQRRRSTRMSTAASRAHSR